MHPRYALSFLLLSASASAQVVNTVQNGAWTSPATWSCACVPDSSQSLVIMHNVDVIGGLSLDQPQVQVTSTGNINMSFPDQVVLNTSFILEGHVFFQGSVTNLQLIDVQGTFELAGVLVNSAQVVMDGGSMIIEGDLLNYQLISGAGSICVYLLTNNNGLIAGTVDICDFSPTTTTPPILDMNSGTVAGTVTYCTNSVCSIMGVNDGKAPQTISITPNPAVDRAVVELPGQRIARGELLSMDGRVVEAGILPSGDRLLVEHPGANGCYLLRLFGTAGQRLGAVRLAFVGR